jgi:hypothetical protein
MENKIIETAELPFGEKVYLKKDWLGWRVVEPIKNPETGKINWFNLLIGGRKGLVFTGVIIILACAFYLGITELIADYKFIASNPCLYCS